jgi:enoyl-CoA hydratase
MFPALDEELDELKEVLSLSATEVTRLRQRAALFPQASAILLPLLRHQEKNNDANALLAESLAYGVLQQSEAFRQWLGQHRRKSGEKTPGVERDVLFLSRKDNLLIMRFNRPAARNAYSSGMRDALFEALCLLDVDDSIEHCIWEGAGDCFCVGGDLSEFGMTMDAALSHQIRMERNVAALLLKNASRIECRVHRACIGSGIELPACVGKLVATRDTFFQLPELTMGLIPGAGGTVSLLRRIGRHRLLWWILSGKRIHAETALAWGLIDGIQP